MAVVGLLKIKPDWKSLRPQGNYTDKNQPIWTYKDDHENIYIPLERRINGRNQR